MSKMSHISVIEKYDEHRTAVQNLLGSILTCFADDKLFEQGEEELKALLNSLCDYYPFISLLYLLDANGRQICRNVPGSIYAGLPSSGQGIDRSRRPYFVQAQGREGVVVTEPYLSSVKRELCLSAIQKVYNSDGQTIGHVVLDYDLTATVAFLTGDSKRIHFEPYFKTVYSLIVLGLFTVSVVLLYLAAVECIALLSSGLSVLGLKSIPFGVVIYLTLALAIFDLGKTTLEEEVLLHKDIFRHSSTRRTITRFIAAIIIAVSIEALLMIFKAALQGGGAYIIQAVWVILAAAVLLLSLGVYVFLGSRAELMLTQKKVVGAKPLL